MITPSALAIILQGAPFPGAVLTVTPGGAALDLTIDGATITFCEGTWFAAERRTSPAHLSFAAAPTAEQVHTEIRRVLAIVKAPAVELTPKTTKIARMAPGHLDGVLLHKPLPGAGDLRLTTEGLHFTVGDITLRYDGEAFHAPRYRVESTLPHPAAINAQGVHAEIHRVLAIVMGAGDRAADLERRLAAIKSDRHEETLRWADEREALRAEVKRLTDAHAIVSQRLAGSQKEVAERDATIEELRGALEAIAAHVGADPWAVEEIQVKVAEFERRGQALDEATARAAKVEDRLRRDDELREQIAVAVGLDGAASLALILDTMTRDRPDDPRAVKDLRALVNYHQAPIKFADRPLTLAERASFVIRRLWQGRTNAAPQA